MSKDKKAFVYLWRDSKNKMWYLGSHCGNNPHYTHSSYVMERFVMNSIPPYMKRRILAYGTREEMADLEVELLKKVISRDDYYNKIVSYPPPPQYGDKNGSWKGGVSNDPIYRKKQMKEYQLKNADELKKLKKEYYQKNKDKFKEYRQKNADKIRATSKIWRENNPQYRKEYSLKNKDKIKEYNLKNKDKIKEYKKEYFQKNKDKIKEYRKEYYQKNKDKIRKQQEEYRQENKKATTTYDFF